MGGNSAALQARVQRRVDALVASGQETGVQVAAWLDGEQIVDVCAGAADAETGRPVTPDTPFFSYSTGKRLVGTLVHVLAEQGQLDYDLRVAEVWPEFARHGKEDVTLRHALTHSAGVPALPADITPEQLADWDTMCVVVADSAPLWAPGTRHGYHAWTYGWLVGETVRRATGVPLARLLVEEGLARAADSDLDGGDERPGLDLRPGRAQEPGVRRRGRWCLLRLGRQRWQSGRCLPRSAARGRRHEERPRHR
jgi:CubicO group peptidase (beta-lactamase class C family)